MKYQEHDRSSEIPFDAAKVWIWDWIWLRLVQQGALQKLKNQREPPVQIPSRCSMALINS